jgi:ribosome-associated protein
VVIEVGKVNPIADYMIITSGDVPTHTRAIADEIRKKLKEEGIIPKIEGYSSGRWIAIDLGDIITHIFLPELREYYQLEWLWQDAPKYEIKTR